MMSYGFGAFGGMGLGMLWGALLLVGLIVLIVWGVMALAGSDRRRDAETPLESLRRRFARGEISEAEFELAKRRLA